MPAEADDAEATPADGAAPAADGDPADPADPAGPEPPPPEGAGPAPGDAEGQQLTADEPAAPAAGSSAEPASQPSQAAEATVAGPGAGQTTSAVTSVGAEPGEMTSEAAGAEAVTSEEADAVARTSQSGIAGSGSVSSSRTSQTQVEKAGSASRVSKTRVAKSGSTSGSKTSHTSQAGNSGSASSSKTSETEVPKADSSSGTRVAKADSLSSSSKTEVAKAASSSTSSKTRLEKASSAASASKSQTSKADSAVRVSGSKINKTESKSLTSKPQIMEADSADVPSGAQVTGGEPSGTQVTGYEPSGTQITGDEPEAGPSGTQVTDGEPEAGPSGTQVTDGEPEAGPSGTQVTGGEHEAGPSGTQVTDGEHEAGPSGTQITGDEPEAGSSGTQVTGDEPEAGSSGTQVTGGESAAAPSAARADPAAVPAEGECLEAEPSTAASGRQLTGEEAGAGAGAVDPEREPELAADSRPTAVKTEVQSNVLITEATAPDAVKSEPDPPPADPEYGPLNPDGLAPAPSAGLVGSASEAARPAAPPPSQLQFDPSAGAPGPGAQLYWQQQLTALSEQEDSLPGPGDVDRRPDQMGFRSPEQYGRRPSLAAAPDTGPVVFPTERRGLSPYPLYGGPELSQTADDDSEEGRLLSELADQLSSDGESARGRPYPLYRPPTGLQSERDSPEHDEPGGDLSPPAAGTATPPAGSPAASSAGQSDVSGDVSGGGEPGRPVLPADHPLMARFQRALAGLLRRQIGKLDLDIVELRREQRARTQHRESVGVQLYERQLQLSRLQQQQQQLQEQLQTAAEARRQAEQTLREVRQRHHDHVDRLEADRAREKELRADVGLLEKHEYHLKSLENDADTELQLRQKMAERADAEMSKLEQDKQRQDYLIARLSSDAERLRTAIRLNQVQSRAQAQECNLARQVLAEAQLELETLVMEKKHLTQTWTNSLNMMQKRDEEYARLQGDVSKMSADLHTVDGEIAGYARSIANAQDNNEQLMMQLRRLQAERDKFQRAYEQTVERFDTQKQEYAQYHHVLTDTEDKLYQCQVEQQQVERRLKHLQADMEKVTDLKRQQEDAIMETMQERLTSESAGKYTGKIVRRTRDVTKYMEAQVSDVENSIARLLLAVSNASTSVTYMNTVVEQLLAEVRLAEDNLNRYQQEIHRSNAVIQHKQNKVQELNTKLGALIAAAGGQELGPLEIMIASLHKAIDQLQQEVDAVQHYYIRLQNDLVFSTQERDALAHVVQTRKKELLILDQRKLRVERSIEAETASLHAVQLSVKQLRQAVCHLNVRLAGETQLHQQLAANTAIMEYELCHALRESETECVQARGEIEQKEQTRAALLARLADAGGRELLWEQKITLLKQAKQKLRGETGTMAEVRAMKLEIHRMQVRYGQLLREQERLMTEMERAVDRRGAIALRAEHAERRGRQRAATFFQRQKRLEDLKRRFKATRRDAAHLQSELTRADRQLRQLGSEAVPGRLAAVRQLRQLVGQLQRGLQHAARLRSQNLGRIVLQQQSAKHYQSLLEGRYNVHIRSRARLQTEADSVDEKYKTVRMLVLRLVRDKPDLERQLSFVKEVLKL